MLKHRLAAVFTWRILTASLVAAVVVAPWLDLARRKVAPACRASASRAHVESLGDGGPPGELPLTGASTWTVNGPVRHVLSAGFAADLPPAKDDEPEAALQPRLLATSGVEPLADTSPGNLRVADTLPSGAGDELQGPSLVGPSTAKSPAPAFDIEPVAATPWSAVKTEARPADSARTRSESLERIAAEADRHTRHAFELAGRGAHFAARAEFIAALRVVAQGLDADQQTAVHSQALASGLTALSEAEDFVPRGGRLEANLDLKQIAAGHTNDILQNEDFARLTPMVALQRYHTYAQEQLALAAEREVAGSMALVGLGKLHVALATRKNSIDIVAAEPKALAFFQAAIIVYPNNAIATNELGVLLARNGHYADARAALEHSVSVSPQPATWHNLALVYRRLNRGDLARQADAHATTGSTPASDAVRWVLPEVFAQAGADSPQSDPPASAPPIASQAKPANAQAAVAPTAKPALFDTLNKAVMPKPSAPAEAKSQSSLSSLFGVPTKRPADTVVAVEEKTPSKPAVFGPSVPAAPERTVTTPASKPTLFATAPKAPAEASTAAPVATKSPAPTPVAAKPFKPALFGAPTAEGSPWPRTATQPAAPAEERRY